VAAAGYTDDPEPDRVVERSGAVAGALAAATDGGVVTRRAMLGGLMTSTSGSAPVTLRGVEPSVEATLSLLDERLTDGAWLADGDGRGVLLGKELADVLGVTLGDKVVFMASARSSDVDSRLFRVAGIFRTGTEALDAFTAVSALGPAQELLPGEDSAHQVAWVRPGLGMAGGMAAEIRPSLASYGDLEVLEWTEALPTLKEQMELDGNFSKVTYGLMALIVAVGVLNTILMGAMERTREFGVVLALGLPPLALAGLLVVEGALIGLGGAALGLLLGLLTGSYLQAYGLDYGDMLAEANPVGSVVLDPIIYGRIDPPTFATYALLTVLLATVASLWPAWRTTSLQPVEAMRDV
jgi:putative ABC transport system permease protein